VSVETDTSNRSESPESTESDMCDSLNDFDMSLESTETAESLIFDDLETSDSAEFDTSDDFDTSSVYDELGTYETSELPVSIESSISDSSNDFDMSPESTETAESRIFADLRTSVFDESDTSDDLRISREFAEPDTYDRFDFTPSTARGTSLRSAESNIFDELTEFAE